MDDRGSSGVPEGWSLRIVGQLTHFTNGKAHENSISENGSCIVVNSKFVSSEGEVVKYSDERFCPAKQDDILIVMSDVPNGRAIAKCFYVDQDDRYTVNQRIGILRATRAEPRFLFYSINRNPYFLAFDDGIKQTNLRKDEVLSCPVLLPPLEEQRKIAAILSTWDEAIGQQTRLIELKRERKRGLMQQLLTGKVRFKEFEGLAWQKVSLGDVLSESRLPGVDKLGKRLTVALHLKGVSARDERGTSEVGKTIYYTRRKDQIIYGKQNLHKGALGIVPKELDGYLSSQDIPAFDVADGFLTAYVCYFLARRSFYEGLEAISTGTGSKRIHPEALFQLRFHFPQYENSKKSPRSSPPPTPNSRRSKPNSSPCAPRSAA